MKIITIHADFIEFEAKKKAFQGAEENIPEGKQRVEECLVVLTAVEKNDERDPQGIINQYVQEIKNIAQQVNTRNIVLYPYAHLSSQLANPKVAEQVLKEARELLADKYSVTRAPFGWYKSFTLACKGHPLSELSRELAGGPSETANLKREFTDEPFRYSRESLTPEQRIAFTLGFILAKAVKDLFKSAQIGEMGLSNQQIYVDFSQVKLRVEDLERIARQVQKIIKADLEIKLSSRDNLKDEWQRKILNDLGQEKPVYSLEETAVVPLCQQPFADSTSKVKAFKLMNLASAYWKGNQNNQQLTRIYAAGFASEEQLTGYLQQLDQAEQRSHITIGRQQQLFVVSDLVGAGLPLLAPKGAIIRNEIINFLWDLHHGKGYQWVWTPHIAKDLLYKTSGHWDKFGDELFHVKGKTEQFVMKPMNCPHHMQIFDHFSWSYRDMPIRFFEPATIYRDEKTGQLHGLSRVRAITQDDGHLFCRVAQIKQEVATIVEIIRRFYKILGMEDYWVSLSVRGKDKSQYLGTDEVWQVAEQALLEAAEENDLPFKRIEGEAAFYGPKLDFLFKDALGREWQLSTIQCDFNLPERFDLSFMNERSLKERPVVIHRAICGSIERFMSILIEHFAGAFPLWLSPEQVRILTITDRSLELAYQVEKKLSDLNARASLDSRAMTMGRKVREAQLAKVNYIVTIGDKEVQTNTLAVRTRSGEQKFGVEIESFAAMIADEIKTKKL